MTRLRTAWGADDDRYATAVAYAIDRCARTTHEIARSLEQDLVRSVNDVVADLGWTLALSDAYPLTIVSVRRHDGAEHERTLLWESVNPAEFNLAQQVANWSEAIRAQVEQ